MVDDLEARLLEAEVVDATDVDRQLEVHVRVVLEEASDLDEVLLLDDHGVVAAPVMAGDDGLGELRAQRDDHSA